MADSTRGSVGTFAAVLGGMVLGFVLGARVRVGNHGAKITIVPVGGDLIVMLPQPESLSLAQTLAPDEDLADEG